MGCNSQTWDHMQEVGMKGDYSWKKSAKAYLDLYHTIDWK